MPKYASTIVELWRSWVGIKEGSSGHKEILAIYNSQNPLPRGYKMTTKDAWCAATMTASAVQLGYTDLIPCECSCSRMIAMAKEMGIWVENESVTPKPGWLCLYDWDDNGRGDNTGAPEHVGGVVTVGGGEFKVVEGNADINRDGKDGVEIRTMKVNGKNLRGFIAPKYDEESGSKVEPVKDGNELKLRTLRRGDEGEDVKALQILLIGTKPGYSCGGYGADGDFGRATEEAVRRYQRDNGLAMDGIVGPKTWAKLLGVS